MNVRPIIGNNGREDVAMVAIDHPDSDLGTWTLTREEAEDIALRILSLPVWPEDAQ